MLRSITSLSKQKKPAVTSSSLCSTIVENTLQRRPYKSDSRIVGDNYRKAFLNAIVLNDELRDSMVYSLAMSSREGSKFPPLTRILNNREREQLRISQLQRRQFRSNSTLSVAIGEEKQEEDENNNIAKQRYQYRKSLFRAIGEDQDLHNSMAYSLAMAINLDNPDIPPATSNRNDSEQYNFGRDKIQNDRMVATKQIYGKSTIGEDMVSPHISDNLNVEIDDYDDDTLSMNSSILLDDEGTAEFPTMTRSLNDREINQLRISKGQLISKCTYPEQRQRQHSLPRTLRDALRPSSEAIVITETQMPFRIFKVNEAWEGLCGYSKVESKGQSLGSLLSGEETDTCAITALIHQLFVHGEEATTVLTNYTKEGRKFRNRLSVGPLYDEETNEVSYFVGILKEVSVAV